ncbi:MAG: tripartite tricarboxylate transporter TctB family protein [Pseudolabrys sp.]|nr:tripartite tricarboxylate transporter TctB family protein [Pseudolabrys sp.]
MHGRDYRDIVTGATIVAFGIFVSVYALTNLQIGTTHQMGPGMFPAGLGVLLCVFGMAILIPAFVRKAELPTLDIRSAVAVLGAIAAFAILFDNLGFVAAVLGLTVISSAGSGRVRLPTAILLAGILLAIALLIFRVGLGMPLPLYKWPF